MAGKRGLGNAGLELIKEELAELIQLTKKGIYHREGKPAPSEFPVFYRQSNGEQDQFAMDFSGAHYRFLVVKTPCSKALEDCLRTCCHGEVDA